MPRFHGISFSYNRSDVLRSISIVRDFVTQLQKTHSFCYFPFLEKTDIDVQIGIDEMNFNPTLALSRVSDLWDSLKNDVFVALEKHSQKYPELKNIDEYRGIVTFYGPYGYYEEPNTVYINISEKNAEFWVETFLHEFLHLVFLEKNRNLSFEETEYFVDSVFVEIFGTIFPHYHTQKFEHEIHH